jgi:GWxTD domain-containing protein
MEQLLLEFSVRATLIAVGTAAVLLAFRIRTAANRHAAWTSVVLFMLLLPVWTAWGPKAPVRVLPPLAPMHGTSPLHVSTAQAVAANAQQNRPAKSVWEKGRGLLAGIYVVGLVTLLGRLFIGTVPANRLAGRATHDGNMLTNASCTAPITVGWFRPQVILPEYWRKWPQAQLNAVLIHENEHARRRDPLVQWLALLNRAIFWFHPLAWWLERRLSVLAEEACDAAVLSAGHDARDYSEYLLDIARSVMQAGGRLHALGSAMPGNFLPKRLRQILETTVAPGISRRRAVCLTAACLLTSVVFAAGTLDHARQPAALAAQRVPVLVENQPPTPLEKGPTITLAQAVPKPAPAAPKPTPDPYERWLEEEAVYIITLAERTAFQSLTSDEERQQFILQFWSRRDPTGAAAPANAMREEHYRRIAYVNEHFGFANTAGWRTDRGRIYITFGPPDELEEHATPIRSQRWLYRYLQGIGNDVNIEFVDPAKNGEFHMTIDPAEIKKVEKEAPKANATPPGGPPGTSLTVDARTYVIGPGDVLFISVWREAILTHQYSVGKDGKIAVPLVGHVQAAGFTPEGLQDQLTWALGKYFTKKEVSVMVVRVNAKKPEQPLRLIHLAHADL